MKCPTCSYDWPVKFQGGVCGDCVKRLKEFCRKEKDDHMNACRVINLRLRRDLLRELHEMEKFQEEESLNDRCADIQLMAEKIKWKVRKK